MHAVLLLTVNYHIGHTRRLAQASLSQGAVKNADCRCSCTARLSCYCRAACQTLILVLRVLQCQTLILVLFLQGQMVHVERILPRDPVYGQLDTPLPDALRNTLKTLGVAQLYSHQASKGRGRVLSRCSPCPVLALALGSPADLADAGRLKPSTQLELDRMSSSRRLPRPVNPIMCSRPTCRHDTALPLQVNPWCINCQ